MSFSEEAKGAADKIRTYWRTPMAGRYMTFREIAAYSGGGIGAYMIITLGSACLLATGNTLISSALGIAPKDMYIMYVIAVFSNIPLTGVRANIIDNTRNKAGKYRPYLVTMAIPTAIICISMVWFPYNVLETFFGTEVLFAGKTKAYIAKCAIIMLFNLLLHFFYYFFYDAYENLIHVLSPNSQERADVSSVKAVVYSIAPTVVNLLTPILASKVFHTNTTDIRVYRLLYPILGVLGILLCIVVYRNTIEKIVQARTHVVQIKFADALRAVAKNKYFWIISLAGWIGFLESSYANILFWLYNYGGVCTGSVYGLVVTLYGNASFWGMLLAPVCIRRWGKKAVLVFTNLCNIAFILLTLPFIRNLENSSTIWFVMATMYLNGFVGSFAHILNPAIQADIRDYQQYRTGERIDGMFSAVATIGTVIALITSSVLPFVYERGGITEANARLVTADPAILGRMLADGKTVGTLLAEQFKNGQDNYINPQSALYDPNVLGPLLKVLIVLSAVGAVLNVVPYFWYDFNERKQKCVVRVLKVRALFEDYGNGVLSDSALVEAIDLIRDARKMADAAPRNVDKSSYKFDSMRKTMTTLHRTPEGILQITKGAPDTAENKALRKAAKKQYKADLRFNEEIEVSKFVCGELGKFSSPLMQYEVAVAKRILEAGLDGLANVSAEELRRDRAAAKALPKGTQDEKKLRGFALETVRNKKSAQRAYRRYFSGGTLFVKPDFAVVEKFFDEEDECDERLKKLYVDLRNAKAAKDRNAASAVRAEIKKYRVRRERARSGSKTEMDKHAYFARAAKPYLDAEKLLSQQESYSRFDEIAAMYDGAKARHAEALAEALAQDNRLKEAEKELTARLKAEKAAKKKR